MLDESGLNGAVGTAAGASIDPDSQDDMAPLARHWLRHDDLALAQDAVLRALDINPVTRLLMRYRVKSCQIWETTKMPLALT